MIIARILLTYLCFTLTVSAFAQNTASQSKKPKETPPLNQYDKKDNKHGMWFNTVAAKMGNPGYSEFGTYYHGEKTGPWYKMNTQNDLIAIENFRHDHYDGEVRYFYKGQLTVVGNYKSLDPDKEVDTIIVEDPVSGRQELVPVSTDRGSVRHGTWRYYDEETGALIKVQEYQVDDIIYEEEFEYSAKDSLYYQLRAKKLPHAVNKPYYQPPAEKQFNYTK